MHCHFPFLGLTVSKSTPPMLFVSDQGFTCSTFVLSSWAQKDLAPDVLLSAVEQGSARSKGHACMGTGLGVDIPDVNRVYLDMVETHV